MLLADPRVVRVMLTPGGSTVLPRIRARHGPFDEQLAQVGTEFFDEYVARLPKDGWTMLDNSASSIDDTVSQVLAILGEGVAA